MSAVVDRELAGISFLRIANQDCSENRRPCLSESAQPSRRINQRATGMHNLSGNAADNAGVQSLEEDCS